MGDLNYMWEKLYTAVGTLASMDAPLRGRLDGAWGQLHRLEAEDFPEGRLRDEYQSIEAGLSQATGGAAGLSDEDADRLAERIVSLYDSIARQMEPVED